MENIQTNLPPELEGTADPEKHKRFLEDLDKAGVRYEAPRNFELGEINYNYYKALAEKDLEMIKKFFTYCRSYLEMPYQYDNFGTDHQARRTWEQMIEQKYGNKYHDFIDRSKFSLGQMQIPVQTLTFFTGLLKRKSTEQYKEFGQPLDTVLNINEFWPKVVNDYDSLSTEEKKKRIELLEDKLYEVLKYVEEITNK